MQVHCAHSGTKVEDTRRFLFVQNHNDAHRNFTVTTQFLKHSANNFPPF